MCVYFVSLVYDDIVVLHVSISVVLLIIRLPPQSTRTYSLCPYTTRFLSGWAPCPSGSASPLGCSAPCWRYRCSRRRQRRSTASSRSEEHTSERQSIMRI